MSRHQILETARTAIQEALRKGKRGREATILVHLAGTGNRSRRLEAVRGAPWGEIEDETDPGCGTYRFNALEVVNWLSAEERR